MEENDIVISVIVSVVVSVVAPSPFCLLTARLCRLTIIAVLGHIVADYPNIALNRQSDNAVLP